MSRAAQPLQRTKRLLPIMALALVSIVALLALELSGGDGAGPGDDAASAQPAHTTPATALNPLSASETNADPDATEASPKTDLASLATLTHPLLNPSAPQPLGTRLDVQVLGPDGAPVRDMLVALSQAQRPSPSAAWPRRRTDAQGWARFDNLMAGQTQVWPQTGAVNTAEVLAGLTTTMSLELEQLGRTLHGSVRAQGGAPLAGASIWSSLTADDERQGAVVAHSDADGHFTLPFVGPGQLLAASAPGYEPSWKLPVEQHQLQPGDAVLFALQRGGHGLDVRVRDGQQRPLAGIPVRAVQQGYSDVGMRPDGSFAVMPPDGSFASDRGAWRSRLDLPVLTDAEGRARLEGLQGGVFDIRVEALADGFALASSHISFGLEGQPLTLQLIGYCGSQVPLPGDGRTLELTLLPEARLRGRITDEQGAPLTGVVIDSRFQGGDVAATTDAEGRYFIRGLQVWGDTPSTFTASHDEYLSTAAELQLTRGQSSTWDLVLSRGGVLTGQLLDEQERPFVGATLKASNDEWRGQAQTDAQGRFFLAGIRGEALRLDVYEHPASAAEGSWPDIERRAEVPGQDLTLVLPRGLTAGQVRGSVVDAGGAPLAAELTLTWKGSLDPAWTGVEPKVLKYAPRRTYSLHNDPASGAFVIDAVRAGRLHLVVKVAGRPSLRLSFELPDVARVHDLGPLLLPAGGTLSVTARVLSGTPDKERLFVRLRRPDGGFVHGIKLRPGDVGSFIQPAGDYLLCLADKTFAAQTTPVTLIDGELLELTLEAQAAPTIWLHAEKPPTQPEPPALIRIRDRAGQLVYAMPWTGRTRLRSPIGLAPGAYEVACGDGPWMAFDAQDDGQIVQLQLGS